MKRQMKMTTSKKPQKKFLGGALKKIMPKVQEAVKSASAAAKKATSSAPAAAAVAPAASSGGRGILGKVMSKVQETVKKAAPSLPAAASPVAAEATKKRMSGLRGIGRALRGKGRALSKAMGMKEGGSVMSDKVGRAMSKKTADARGRAMKGK